MGIWNWTVAEGSVLWTPSQTNFTKNTLIEHCITLQLGGNWCSYHSDWALYDCVMKEKMAVPEIVINSIKLDMAMHQSRRFLPPMGLTSPSPGLGAILDSSPVSGAAGSLPLWTLAQAQQALDMASSAGALTCTKPGAIAAQPTLEQVLSLMKKGSPLAV